MMDQGHAVRWRALEEFYCGLRGRCRFAGLQMSGDEKGGRGCKCFGAKGGGRRRKAQEVGELKTRGEMQATTPPRVAQRPRALSIACHPAIRARGRRISGTLQHLFFFSSSGANTSTIHLQATTGKVRMQTARVQVDSRRPASPVSQARGSRLTAHSSQLTAHTHRYRNGGRREGGGRQRWAKAVSPVPVPVPFRGREDT